MSRASRPIWDFVAGLPSSKRGRRLIFMLQAYIDDSKTHADPLLFILAGYLAPAEQWAEFSDEWQRFLDMDPRIEYFKLREALRGVGEFDGRAKKLCTERIVLMRGIIEKYDLREFAIGFELKDYEKHYLPSMGHRVFDNPYFFASTHLAMQLARRLPDMGVEPQPIEFIFDEQVREKAGVIQGWDFARDFSASHPEYETTFSRGLIFHVPAFRDDKDVLPLQAADMHATYIRLLLEARHNKKPAPTIPGKKRDLRGFFLHFNKTKFRREIQRTAAIMNDLRRRGHAR